MEHVQDLVELVLMEEDYPAAAKAYILYRSERTRARVLWKRYRENPARAIELNLRGSDAENAVKSLSAKIVREFNLTPSLEGDRAYLALERPALAARYGISEQQATVFQSFAHRHAKSETERATYQAMESLLHNLYTMESRAGAQVPFSSLIYGMDTSPKGRMAVESLLLATEAGLGGGETPIFPIQIFRVKDGVNFNPGEPNYDLFKLACRCSAKPLFPNFVFHDAPFNLPYYQPGRPETEISTIGCRARVVANVHDPDRVITYQWGLNVWCWSSYLFESLLLGTAAQQALLQEIAVLVVGPFLLEQRTLALPWRGVGIGESLM